MNILIVSDAWHPQINGVVRTLELTVVELEKAGHKVAVYGPDAVRWNTIAAPTYPSIKLELFGRKRLAAFLDVFRPDVIHIATEGPLGWAARNLCLHRRLPFTTSYHTRFPEYVAARMPRGMQRAACLFTYAAMRRFHAPSSAVFVATASIEQDLHRRKFRRLVRWSRGVDTQLFRPDYGKDTPAYENLPRPIMISVGRVAVEKNLRAFLDADVPGSKIVVGDGPDLERLKAEYPSVKFPGVLEGEVLARHYAAADIFVFPSLTDTFGLVLLEAAASGLRIACVPAPGPADLFADETTRGFAVLNTDLTQAIKDAAALPANPELSRRFAETFSWAACTEVFYEHLQAPTPDAVRRITRLRNWLARWWQHALAYAFK